MGKKPPLDGFASKIQVVMNLIQLGGGMAMPKLGGKVITFMLFVVICFLLTGIGCTFYWLIQLFKFIF